MVKWGHAHVVLLVPCVWLCQSRLGGQNSVSRGDLLKIQRLWHCAIGPVPLLSYKDEPGPSLRRVHCEKTKEPAVDVPTPQETAIPAVSLNQQLLLRRPFQHKIFIPKLTHL